MPRGVIFDMDGVLVDSGPAHHESWRRLAERHGIEVSEERFKQSFGRPSRDIIRIIWGDRLAPSEIQRLDAEKESLYREIISGNVPLMPGCHAALESLHQAGLILAVATSGPAENLELVISEGRIARFFAATVNGFEIAHGKPEPDCFLLAAQRIGLRPQECVVVEDAPVGVQAGVAAGMKAIGLAGTHPPAALTEAGAAEVVQRLEQITPELVS